MEHRCHMLQKLLCFDKCDAGRQGCNKWILRLIQRLRFYVSITERTSNYLEIST